jgi:hypothetical protein
MISKNWWEGHKEAKPLDEKPKAFHHYIIEKVCGWPGEFGPNSPMVGLYVVPRMPHCF